jgi:hypothetical protein
LVERATWRAREPEQIELAHIGKAESFAGRVCEQEVESVEAGRVVELGGDGPRKVAVVEEVVTTDLVEAPKLGRDAVGNAIMGEVESVEIG